jgi:P-type Ca2+ transporter type 2C
MKEKKRGLVETLGLTEKRAKERLKEVGKNEIEDLLKISPLKILVRQIRSNFFLYLLLFAMIISFYVDKLMTAYVILLVIIIIITTGFIQEYRAEKAIDALKSMIMPVSIVIRDNEEKEILSTEIVPGDVVVLRNGEKIPADCVIIKEKDLLINESVLTGESREVKKFASEDLEKWKDENFLFMGSFIVNGKCTAKVIHTGMNTKFGKIAGMISTAEKELPLQKKVNTIVKYTTFFGVFFAILTGVIMILRAETFNSDIFVEVLILVIAIAVSSFPEGFPVVLISSLASGSYRMAQKNAIVNRMSIIETLGETTVICSDKTGTITKGEMTVKKIYTDDKLFNIEGSGYEGNGDFLLDGSIIEPKKEKTLSLLIKASILCNDSKIKRTGEDNHYYINGMPTEASLLILGAKAKFFKEDFNYNRIEEIPFSSERKMMTVLVNENRNKIIYTKGAIEYVLKKCKYIQRDNGIFRLTNKNKEKILKANQKMTINTLRTLAIAYKKADSINTSNFENDLIFLGLTGLEDPPRDEIKDAVINCKKAGIKIKMITGDNKETALSIAKQINIGEGMILEGSEIERLSEEELKDIVKRVIIFARVKPEHKLRIVKALKDNGEIVTMTGDGVNDAPALKEAHIGVAMGKNGTDVSRSVADLTLKDDNFATIVDAVKEGRTIFTNIQKFSTYQMSINFAQVALIFLAILLGLPLPLVAIQILFMNLFSDELTAITLSFNPYSKDVMNHNPRKKSSIISKPLFFMLALSGIVMSVGSLIVFYYALSIGKSEISARTLTFVTMVFFGITNAFNFRSFRKPTINRSLLTNKPLVYVSLIVIIMTIVILYSPLGVFLELSRIKPIYVLGAFFVSLLIVLVFDLLKHVNEKYHFWSEDMQLLNINNIGKNSQIEKGKGVKNSKNKRLKIKGN